MPLPKRFSPSPRSGVLQSRLLPNGILLGGALVLAFAARPVLADEVGSTPVWSTPDAPSAVTSIPAASQTESQSLAARTREDETGETPASEPLVSPPLVPDLPALTSEVETRVSLRKRARRVRTSRVSAVNAASAWRAVDRGTRAITSGNFASALSNYQQAARLDPTNPYALSGVADSLLSLGRNAEAERAYRRALLRTPGNLKLQKGLASALVPQRKYTEAIGLLKRIATASPRDFEANYQLAQALTWTQRYREADAYYRRAITLQPKSPVVWTAWGESLSYSRDNRAKDAFLGALKVRPRYSRAQIGLGNMYLWNAEYAEAGRAFKSVLAREPRNLEALVGVGEALSFTNAQTEAIPYYQRALSIAPQNTSAQIGLGRALIQTRREKEGAPYIQRVLQREPRNAVALQLLADAQSATTSGGNLALATFEKLLKAQREPADQAETWVRIAQLHNTARNWDKADAAYQKAISLAPRDAEISLAYAQALIGENKWDAARAVVEDLIRREPGNVRALTMQVVVESKTGSPERAASLANRLLAFDLSTPADALVLAEALRTAGNPVASKRVLERLAAQNASDPATALQVAVAVRDAGLYDLATPLFERLLTTSPRNNEARHDYAEMLLWQNRYDAAAQQIATILRTEPNNLEARVLSATIALRRDEKSGLPIAEREAAAILALDSRNTDARILQTQTLSLRQRYAEAVAAAKLAVDAAPANLEARLALARNLYYARQTPAAITQYRELIKRAPGDVSVKIELAQIYMDQNQLSDAEALYRDVLVANGSLLPPVSRQGNAEFGAVLRSYARVSPALKPFKSEPLYQAPAWSTPGRKASRLRRVSAVASPTIPSAPGTGAPVTAPASTDDTAPMNNGPADNGNNADSLPPATSTRRAPATGILSVKPAPGDAAFVEDETFGDNEIIGATADGAPVVATAAEAMNANVGLGEVRRRQGRFDEAIGFFNAALESDSSNVAARLGLAQSLRGKTEYLRSLAEAERVLATDEKNLGAQVLRAQLLADTGQSAQADAALNGIVADLPANPSLETYFSLAEAFVGLQNYAAALDLLQLAREDYPARAEVTTRMAETYTAARRWDEALTIWNQHIALDPTDASAVLGKARVYNYSERLLDAEASYRRALELEPNSYVALTELADVLGRQSEYPDAIALYEQAISLNPEDLKIRVELARVLRYNRQFALSETVLNDVIATDARYAPAYTERSLARSGQGNFETAVLDARRALEITPSDSQAQLGLAEVLSNAQQYDESIRLYQAALERDPKNEKARVELGATLAYAGRYDESIAQINAVLKDNPQNLNAQILRADAYARAGRTSESITAYNAILQRDGRNLRARVGLAEAYSYARQYDKSVAVYDQLIASDPSNAAYKIAKGNTLGYARRYPEAISVLRPVVAANPNSVPARLALAGVLTNSGNAAQRKEAVSQYQTILQSDAQNVDARIGLGRVYSYSGQYKFAERELNTVLARYPQNRDARFALAESQRFAGRPFDARENYRQVLQADTNNVGANAGLLTVSRELAIGVTPSITNYSDTNGVRLRSYSLGAVVPTRAGTIGLIGETGNYRDDDETRRRRAISLLLARQFGAVQARLLLSRVNYSGAPSKTLYDLILERRFNARKRIFANVRELDIVESVDAIDNGITDRQLRAGGAYPLGRFDLELELIRHKYSDGNDRTSISPSILFRVIDGQAQGKPTLRVGVGYQYDNTREFSPFYYTPQDYKTFALLADLVKEQGRLRYGLFAVHPLKNETGGAGGAPNRPSDTLFGFVNYDITDVIELFVNGGVVRGPNFDSNQLTAGATVRFR